MKLPESEIRRIAACSLAIVVGLVSALSSQHAEAQLRRIAIGSNPAGTNYYVVASGIAKLLQDETGIPSTVRPFSGSSVYMPMLQRGEIAFGPSTRRSTARWRTRLRSPIRRRCRTCAWWLR